MIDISWITWKWPATNVDTIKLKSKKKMMRSRKLEDDDEMSIEKSFTIKMMSLKNDKSNSKKLRRAMTYESV